MPCRYVIVLTGGSSVELEMPGARLILRWVFAPCGFDAAIDGGPGS